MTSINSQTYLTPGEQIIENSLKVLYTTEIAYSARVVVKLKFIMYMSGLFTYVSSFKTVSTENNAVVSDHENEWAIEGS